jgi:D-serine deaminase-like pyridoxal phosphate-dependent protein
MQLPTVGAAVDQLETPCLVVDLDAFERNIEKMSAYCRSNGVAWRPHSKCHKSPAIAHKLIEAGAVGMTCAKLGEAEVMAAGGVTDLLIANPLPPSKAARLVALCSQADPIAVVDHADHVDALSAAASAKGVVVPTLVEVDVGMKRCGAAAGEATVKLAQRITAAPGLRLDGIMGYEGHLLTVADPAEKKAQIEAAMDLLVESRAAIERVGLPCPTVSAGGTGSYEYTAKVKGLTEMQAGGGIFMDLMYRDLCHVPDLELALFILSTVSSRPTSDRAVIDAGRKTMNQEILVPQVHNRPGVTVDSLSAEHGVLKLASGTQLSIGERLEIIPGYGDFTTVLHNFFFGVRGGRIETIWPLEGRGRLD